LDWRAGERVLVGGLQSCDEKKKEKIKSHGVQRCAVGFGVWGFVAMIGPAEEEGN
jgi:hypothetical protein